MGNYSSSQYLSDLKNASVTHLSSFEGLSCYVKVAHITDGDTFHLIFKTIQSKNAPFVKHRVRMAHYDAPEKNTLLGKEATEYAEKFIGDKIFWCKFLKNDKYGRPLVELFHKKNDKYSINQEIIDYGYGKPYEGKGPKFMEQ